MSACVHCGRDDWFACPVTNHQHERVGHTWGDGGFRAALPIPSDTGSGGAALALPDDRKHTEESNAYDNDQGR